jgi:hypothetical protein
MYEINWHHSDYWEPITESEVFGLLMQEAGEVTPALFEIACGGEVCFETFTLREARSHE